MMQLQHPTRILPMVRLADRGPELRRVAVKLLNMGFEFVATEAEPGQSAVPVIDLHLYRPQCDRAAPACTRDVTLRVAVLSDAPTPRQPDLEANALADGFDEVIAAGASCLCLEARLIALSRRRSLLIEIAATADAVDVRWLGHRVDMSGLLRRVLVLLWRQRGGLVTRDAIISACWLEPDGIFDRTVDSTIKRLRRCLRAAGAPGSLIQTRNRLGYAMDPDIARACLAFVPHRHAPTH